MEIAFLNPGSADDPFFGKLASFMHIAADQLAIELEVIDCRLQRSRMVAEAEALLARSRRPEYLVLGNPDGAAIEVLPRATEKGVKVLLINEGIMSYDSATVGRPRRPLANWLGQLQPDDQQAGELLAENLLEVAQRKGCFADDGAIHLAAIAGDHNWSSNSRVVGLNRVVSAAPNVTMNIVRLGEWSRERARDLTTDILGMFPKTTVVWAASDLMAVGAIEAIEAADRVPGEEIMVGGVDWAMQAYERIREGTLTASVGGHFMEGAWAMVMLYDHHHGKDFATTKVKSSFVVLTAENLSVHSVFFEEGRWAEADFARLSKVKNPAIGSYAFTPNSCFASLP